MIEPLGLEPGTVRLAEYDGRWVGLFEAESRRILAMCGPLPLRLEHVGGTAIPGMCSKPILDVAAGRPPDAPVRDYVDALRQAGYEHRGERGVAGREFFCRGEPRAYHLHLVADGGPLWEEYLAFRDYLRAHTEAAGRFAAVKRDLAERFSSDREGYLAAKSSYVREILEEARRAAGARDRPAGGRSSPARPGEVNG